MPRSFKKFLNFSTPSFWAILTEPIFPDLINISSAVKSLGISLSYSPIGLPPQKIFFSKLTKGVSVLITPSFNPAAKVKVLKTDPNS